MQILSFLVSFLLFLLFYILFFPLRVGWSTGTSPTRTSNIHSVPNVGIGKGVSHESLLDPKKKDRNGSRTLFVGKANQNLVSKSSNETKERNSSNKGTE